ncbi:MAG: hypothetical protein HQL09_00060 [Nitrospirae bacterium]|nr:hypothetical protein [Nitrospirota bacterium]
MPTALIIAAFAFILNLPFGYIRKHARKYSVKWFLCIHIPVPMIIIARITTHTNYFFIPVFILVSIAGQICGGKINLRRTPPC